MSLKSALSTAVSEIPECLAAGYVDMASGMLLGVQTVDSHPQEVLDMVAAATADLFQGKNVVVIENMFKKARGQEKDKRHYFHEIIVFSEHLLHVFLRSKKFEDQVFVIVCRKSANIGMVLTKSRLALEGVSSAV
jgi:hypothetical protein